ncbi:MAG: hypothetical protein HYX28_06105 [Candidatus Koribacter versatilis]|uniref:DUF4013 domain-containing protein n=1 Tax=Candidatus Korobacter versatilis TaxID=658062 RepID=A0A932A7V7_9BACT|nr:hypothetical protein [Candidatus Koribacter versatilis]
MIPAPLTPVDCVSPAVAHAKRLLFQPFRMRFWLKLAILAVLSGALTGGCNGNFNFRNFGGMNDKTSTGAKDAPGFGKIADSIRTHPGMWAGVATGVVAFLLIVFVVFMFVSSVLRFVWLDALLAGQFHIRAGWRFWRHEGVRLFGWQLLFGMVSTGGTLALIAIPLWAAWKKGILTDLPRHLPEFFAGAAVTLLAIAGLALISFFIGTFIHDFVVPTMRYQRAGFLSAWQTAWDHVGATPGSLALYYLFKVVLLIAASIVVGIVSIFVFLIVLLPLLLIGVIAVLLGALIAAGLGPVGVAILITLGVLFGLAFGFGLAYLNTVVTLPVTVFMQYYGLYYFGSRYHPLGAQLVPELPPAPVAPPLPPLVPPPTEPGPALA